MGDISEVVSPPAEEYFDEKVILTDQEVFIDCGGFDGDTSVEFIERCGGKYDNIIIFEPELCKKEAIEKNIIRKDLFYRLSGNMIYLPPLRERKADIEYLIDNYIDLNY